MALMSSIVLVSASAASAFAVFRQSMLRSPREVLIVKSGLGAVVAYLH